MSQENVEIVLRVHPDPDADFAQLLRDDDKWGTWVEELRSFFHPDWETVRPTLLDSTGTHVGFDASRVLWLNWLAPWESYRVQVAEAIDCGERVLSFSHDLARLEGSASEVTLAASGGVWTFRDGRIARLEIYEDRGTALKSVGLADG